MKNKIYNMSNQHDEFDYTNAHLLPSPGQFYGQRILGHTLLNSENHRVKPSRLPGSQNNGSADNFIQRMREDRELQDNIQPTPQSNVNLNAEFQQKRALMELIMKTETSLNDMKKDLLKYF